MTHTTRLAVPIFSETVDRLRESIFAAIDAGATLLELRLDLCAEISDDNVRTAVSNLPPNLLLLLTNRSSAQGGECPDDDIDRLSRMDRLAPWFDLIDVELETWRASERHRDLVRQALAEPGERPAQVEVHRRRRLVLSLHDFRGRPKSMQNDLLACADEPSCDIVKIAWHARSVRDCFEAFEIMRTCPKPAIAVCMGSLGVLSRMLAPKFGAFASFASLDRQTSTAPGQLAIRDLKRTYRWDALDASTAVFGVIGHPVSHSLSPAVHNAVFAETRTNAAYVPIDVAPGYESLKAFLLEVEAKPQAGFRGFSVTIPHKEHAIRFLRECGGAIDAIAERVGAVNTLAFDSDSGWRGTNTDYRGAVAAITAGLEKSSRHIGGLRALVLGAGGASRAVVAALVDLGADVTIANRTVERASGLAAEFGVQLMTWDRRAESSPGLIVNCTSVGMTPDTTATPWSGDGFAGNPLVFDTIYAPADTQLLRDARAAGCSTVGGSAMFSNQAAAQWEFWMGTSIDAGTYDQATAGAMAASVEPFGAPTDF
ncbi:MAG: type I 3-dehydroquinate dehydratase [Phycisphaerales bacterium]|nr:type I 3-dehydroquinate dehydratase [Phycisphaerales bacterium]MCB9858050.1 type I 3-dehydroquinate dehydratase [Phycisphaerales bacterium]MCB9864147.1 type I 3-dehydroquinate dehydratase [Phycisphaerales bacterium]